MCLRVVLSREINEKHNFLASLECNLFARCYIRKKHLIFLPNEAYNEVACTFKRGRNTSMTANGISGVQVWVEIYSDLMSNRTKAFTSSISLQLYDALLLLLRRAPAVWKLSFLSFLSLTPVTISPASSLPAKLLAPFQTEPFLVSV